MRLPGFLTRLGLLAGGVALLIVAAVGVIWAPLLAALGALAALVTNVTIEVEKVDDTTKPKV